MSTPVIQSALASTLSLLRAGQLEHQKVMDPASSETATRSAADHATYWSIAHTFSHHAKALAASHDTASLSQSMADIAVIGLKASVDLVGEIRSTLLEAAAPPSMPSIEADRIEGLKSRLTDMIGAASFAGQNWLEIGPDEKAGPMPVVAGIAESETGLQIVTIDRDTSDSALISRANPADGILTRPVVVTTPSGQTQAYHLIASDPAAPPEGSRPIALTAKTSPDDLAGMLKATGQILEDIAHAIARTGLTSSRLSGPDSYLSSLQGNLDGNLAPLVEGDIDDQLVRLRATEVQYRLQATALSIMNENARTLLDLFR